MNQPTNDAVKKLINAIEINDVIKMMPIYDEFKMWQQSVRQGDITPIREYVLDTMVRGEKSALSLIVEQAIFLTDEQKASVKRMYNGMVDEFYMTLKDNLEKRGMVKK